MPAVPYNGGTPPAPTGPVYAPGVPHDTSESEPAKLSTDFKRWLIAGVVITLPLIAIQRTNPDWQYPYVMLILLSLVIFYADELSTFIREVQTL